MTHHRDLFHRVFIIMLSTVPIFSTDMYLPAMPKMVELFGAPLKLVNLTLVLFLVLFAGSSLVWGTLSDKYGRKPILLISTSTYVVSSFLCAFAGDIYALILFRSLQGIGGGAAMAISMAIVKDLFNGKQRERLLVYQGSLMAVAPIVAPIVGAQVLLWTSWRGTFVILGLFGALLFLGSLVIKESAAKHPDRSLLKTMGNLKKLGATPAFITPLIVFAVAGMPILMFVGSASHIYITHFGLSERTFSLFFGFNAAFSVVGSFAYIVLAKHLKTRTIITGSFAAVALAGACLIGFGGRSPMLFALCGIPSALAMSVMRPPSMNILLEQGKKDAGAASSL